MRIKEQETRLTFHEHDDDDDDDDNDNDEIFANHEVFSGLWLSITIFWDMKPFHCGNGS